jgi:hypothetical protein
LCVEFFNKFYFSDSTENGQQNPYKGYEMVSFMAKKKSKLFWTGEDIDNFIRESEERMEKHRISLLAYSDLDMHVYRAMTAFKYDDLDSFRENDLKYRKSREECVKLGLDISKYPPTLEELIE